MTTKSAVEHLRPKRVMVVEDDGAILEVLAPILEEEGYQVSTAFNGGEALERLAHESRPDVIVLDLRMPVMDGWTFRTAQKKDSRLASIPVVAISADGTSQAEAISADAFLRKPLALSELLETLARVLADAERRNQSSHREQVERLASLGRLAAGVGHEINNPLAFVLLNMRLASERLQGVVKLQELSAGGSGATDGAVVTDPLAKEARELVELVDESLIGLERIRRTVQNLQSLTRRSDDKYEGVDIEKVLDESINMARSATQHRARVVKRYGAVPRVRGRGTALGQVCLNLLINAAQSIPEGNAAGNQIQVTTSFDGTCVVIEIVDTGRGIAADVLPHIFEPFFTTKSVAEGTGLGLAICQQIVSDHRGQLAIESELGRGTQCRLSLPPAEESEQPEAPAAPTARPSGASTQRRRVLVIDDEVQIGQVVTRLLSPRHDVIACETARDAFALLARGVTFDVVLCDVLMPDAGGAQVFDELAARWPSMLSQLVFMTGGVSSPEVADFLTRVGRPLLQKPFTCSELETLIEMQAPRLVDP